MNKTTGTFKATNNFGLFLQHIFKNRFLKFRPNRLRHGAITEYLKCEWNTKDGIYIVNLNMGVGYILV